MALLLVVVCSTLFMLLGLSLTFSSMTEFAPVPNLKPAKRPCSLPMGALT